MLGRNDDGKLIPAQAVGPCPASADDLQGFRRLLQEGIPHMVAQAVIDGPEVVEVHIEQGPVVPGTDGGPDFIRDIRLELEAVGKAGQEVGIGLVFNGLLVGLQVRNIREGGHGDFSSVHPADGCEGNRIEAGRVLGIVFSNSGAGFPRDGQDFSHGRPVGGIGKHLLELPVGIEEDLLLRVIDGNAGTRVFQDGVESRIGGGQGILRDPLHEDRRKDPADVVAEAELFHAPVALLSRHRKAQIHAHSPVDADRKEDAGLHVVGIEEVPEGFGHDGIGRHRIGPLGHEGEV